MTSAPMWKNVQRLALEKGVGAAFIECLLWDAPNKSEIDVLVPNAGQVPAVAWKVTIAAQLQGAYLLEIKDPSENATSVHRAIDKELQKRFPERILIFSGVSLDIWYWPKRMSNGAISYERLEVVAGSMPDFIAQRLAGLAFTPAQIRAGVSSLEVRQRLRGNAETSKVTAKFYKLFSLEHKRLTMAIQGLEGIDRENYSTLLMNRLMFIYFLQKKEFLNKDSNYLSSCMERLQSLAGEGRFYNFYRDYLLELFFNKLDDSNGVIRDENIREIVGVVPYLNGGLFAQNTLELTMEISIPDDIFKSIFKFFDSFTWHLDTRPTGVENEINPEVIGYIFEQYINFTADGKKKDGAYYTKHDVTGHMLTQTLVPRILDECLKAGLDFSLLLVDQPHRYIHDELLVGYSSETSRWLEVDSNLESIFNSDPETWHLLDDSKPVPGICLPDETWVEVFYRRARVDALLQRLATGDISTVNDLLTLNLNIQNLLSDLIDSLDQYDTAMELWQRISDLSVIDPTCGSGAFLFAALEVFEDVYGKLLSILLDLESKEDASVRTFTELVTAHPNHRYFIRKHVAMRNLFGTDLMPGAIETAKLRIFLALAACLETVGEIEPLPDLDFNLKVGNLVVGFQNLEDLDRVREGDVGAQKVLDDLEVLIRTYEADYAAFQELNQNNDKSAQSLKVALRETANVLRRVADGIFYDILGLPESDFENWVANFRPFHWFAEFPSVIARGGFDVVVGNPPYIAMPKKVAKNHKLNGVIGFSTLDCPNFYAVCYERSLSLTHPQGRHSFVVMLNLSFGDDFKILREIINKRQNTQWWSTYDQLPQGLFSVAAVRNTILTLGPGEVVRHVTHHQIFTVASRSWLFANLEYFECPASLKDSPVRAGVASKLAGELLKLQLPPDNLLRAGSLVLKATSNYWVPVAHKRPPVLDLNLKPLKYRDKKISELKIETGESEVITLALLAGKIGFMWWQARGDGFDVVQKTLREPRALGRDHWNNPDLTAIAQSVLAQGIKNTVVNKYDGKNYVSIRWAGIRQTSDAFDKQILEVAGLNQHWRALNIHYRQTMRSDDSRQMNQDTDRNEKLWDLSW